MLNVIKRWIPATTRQAMRVALHFARHRPHMLSTILRRVRPGSVCDVLAYFEDGGSSSESEFEVFVYGIRTPVRLRRGTSDFAVFRQVFLEEQYSLDIPKPAEYVIDAGANIGLTSVYLLNRFPQCRIVAIEPDPENYLLAKHNLVAYSSRCQVVRAGLWGQSGTLAVSQGTFRDGLHWATQTVPMKVPSGNDVPARTLQSLLDEFQFPRIDFLKVDIEGAELSVFSDGDVSFLERTGCCAIECHGDDCVRAFTTAATAAGFRIRESGELMIADRIADTSHAVPLSR